MGELPVVIVGAGVGGLSAAVVLASHGLPVTLLERAAIVGGKLHRVEVGGRAFDAGPTVFTMRFVFDELFAEAGASLDQALALTPLSVLARHAWSETERLDLFADRERSADAIGAFAGAAAARGYRAFCREARRIYETLETSFIRAPEPSLERLIRSAGLFGLPQLWGLRPFATLWDALGSHFHDPRLRQLFGRYATYCGSSPFQAPATLMLVAHVEQEGVWSIEGGLAELAQVLANLATARGAALRLGAEVVAVEVSGGAVSAVHLADGERLPAAAVIANVDAAAFGLGLLGPEVREAVRLRPGSERSLSALTFGFVARPQGLALERHTVFFSGDYRAEFDELTRGLPSDPTVYLCAPDQPGAPDGPEPLFGLVNAPARGDTAPLAPTEIKRCLASAFERLRRCGLSFEEASPPRVTTPSDWHARFPGTGGALYGRASHGWRASFERPGARSRLPGLYLAGGSVHPGPGVPMAALSGRMAAAALLQDRERLASTVRSPRTAMPGGTSMR